MTPQEEAQIRLSIITLLAEGNGVDLKRAQEVYAWVIGKQETAK